MSEQWLLAAVMLHIGLLLPYAFQLIWLSWNSKQRSKQPRKDIHEMRWEDELIGEPSSTTLNHNPSRWPV